MKKALGDVHADLTITSKEECTMEHVLSELLKVIASDSASGSFSIAKLKADYEAMIASTSTKASGSGPAAAVALTRKTAAQLGNVRADQALKAVREELGAFNWALFTPDNEFVDAGSLSAPEMQKCLAEDQFFYGILRMGFGSGRFRRTKWVAITWSGPKVGAVKRGKALSARSGMKSKLSPYNVEIEASDKEELSLEAIIDKVKRAAVVDGDDVGTKAGGEDPYSVENFMKALQEEAAANAAFFGDSGLVMGGVSKSADMIVKELRSPGATTNWALFTVNI